MSRLNHLIKRIVPTKLFEWLYIVLDKYALKSYSQEGEDMILRRLFEKRASGFYIDVGAHHPMRFSNTYFFYKKGWRGINIDAMPGSMHLFAKYRREDINLEIPISSESKLMKYYVFNESALSGFDEKLSIDRDRSNDQFKINKTVLLETRPLSAVLDEHILEDKKIDFLSVDVEGLDLDVLKSNDWSKYRPEVVLVEVLGKTLLELENSNVTSFLKEHGYMIYAKTVSTVIYKHNHEII